MNDFAAQPIISSQHGVLPVVAQNVVEESASAAANAGELPSTDLSSTAVAEPHPEPATTLALLPEQDASDTRRPPRPNDPMIVFAYDCLQREFDALMKHQPADNAAPSAQEVHQMRIATRRLRVALRLFRRMLPNEAKDLRNRLSRFARALGEVRDLDVYGDNFRTYTEAVPPESIGDLGGYELHLRRERTAARSKLTALFGDERHAQLLQSFAAFLAGAPSPPAVRRWRSFKVADGVDKYLKKSLKRVLKLGHKIGDEAHAKDLHRLRIRTKRFRYELEFFVAIYPSFGKAAKATKVLQDLLGVHQDACTATERLETYVRGLGKRPDGTMPAAALATLVASQRQQARDVRGKFGAAWRTFEHTVARGKLA
jgi:CHAD domain-containing protein